MNTQLAGYIFAHCIALAPSLPLLAGFAVQSLLAVSLLWLASREEVLRNTAVLTLAYPEGFRCRYTGLGAQTMCPNY